MSVWKAERLSSSFIDIPVMSSRVRFRIRVSRQSKIPFGKFTLCKLDVDEYEIVVASMTDNLYGVLGAS
jgi:hypothetical protein